MIGFYWCALYIDNVMKTVNLHRIVYSVIQCYTNFESQLRCLFYSLITQRTYAIYAAKVS